MKFNKNRLALAIVGVAAVGVASLGTAGITDSKHDLSSTAVQGGAALAAGQGEICVFCHTPHGSATGASVPLWNKTLPSTVYQTYDQLGTSSLDGGVASVGSVSLACLSCHDGTQAMDNMLNEPGSGAGSAGNNTATKMSNVDDATFEVPKLGADLRNDHPVGIQYCGGGYTETSTGTASVNCTDKDFEDAVMITLNETPIWYVETSATASGGSATVRDKYDMQLYTRDSSGSRFVNAADFAGENEPFVECASCHDPHAGDAKTFLRLDNAGSAVCLACHTK